jgi:RNA polymerase sigma-70 factor (ECF subfamily)
MSRILPAGPCVPGRLARPTGGGPRLPGPSPRSGSPRPAAPGPDALARLYDAFAGRAFGYLLRLVHDRAAAEDLLQESFVRVSRRLPELREEGAARSYLFRAATNLAIDRLRRLRRVGFVPLDALPPEREPLAPDADADGSRVAESRDRAAVVRGAIAALPPRERAALMLRVVEGLGLADVGDALAITDRGAARVVRQALARLRGRLSRLDSFSDLSRRTEREPLRP